jgi:hypothetical protein
LWTEWFPLPLGLLLTIRGFSRLIPSEVQEIISEKKDKMSLLLSDFPIDESNWYQSKQFLARTHRGREILNWAENHLETSCNNILFKNTLLFKRIAKIKPKLMSMN